MGLPSGRAFMSRLYGRLRLAGRHRKTGADALIVRRGLSPDYYFFAEIFAEQNSLEVVLDRRVDDERRRRSGEVSAERRCNDRRGALPATWDEGDIVVAPKPR